MRPGALSLNTSSVVLVRLCIIVNMDELLHQLLVECCLDVLLLVKCITLSPVFTI